MSAALEGAAAARDAVEASLSEAGALVFRGFPIDAAEDFASFVEALAYPNFSYDGAGGNAVRRNVVGDRVFTANESPPERRIPFHHELAQSPRFPHRVLFFCDVPAASGGATPILDSHEVYAKLKRDVPDFMEALEAKGVRYTRVMTAEDRPESAVGRGWRGTFGAETPEALMSALNGTGQRLEWLPSDHPGVSPGLNHPVRHFSAILPAVRVDDADPRARPRFFNQILAAYAGWRDELNPAGKSVVFGDGTEMPVEAFEAMERIFEEEAVAVPWQHGDVMLINNLQVMHAREAFVNAPNKPRRVLASLAGDPRAGGRKGGNGERRAGRQRRMEARAVRSAGARSQARGGAASRSRWAVSGGMRIAARAAAALRA